MSTFNTTGLSLELAPPTSVPLSFFALAPIAIVAAGLLLLVEGMNALTAAAAMPTLALTHIATLGLLTSVMMGAIYQLTPVLGGAPVPWVRLGYFVCFNLALGATSLGWSLLTVSPELRRTLILIAITALFLALLIFVIQASIGLARSPAGGTAIQGMRGAIVALLLVGLMGVWMVHGFAGMSFPHPRLTWLQVHISLALLGWIGTLVMSASLKLIPMFYLAPELSPRVGRILLWVHGGSLLGTAIVPWLALFGLLDGMDPKGLATALVLPSLGVVWIAHPVWVLSALHRRRRRRVDPSKNYWVVAMVVAPAIVVVTVCNYLGTDLRWGLTFGWLAIWGWAGLVIHGMLTRIVPFLVWLRRYSAHVGLREVPSIRTLYPASMGKLGLALHTGSLVLGMGAIWTKHELVVRLTAVLLVCTGIHLAIGLLRTLRFGKVQPTQEPSSGKDV